MFHRIKQCKARDGRFRVILWIGAAFVSLTLPARSAPTLSPPERAQSYTFAFHDADISQVSAEILGKALGLTYIVDPGVTGKMSFQIDKKLTGAQLLEAFEAVLEDSDVSLVREGDALAVKPRDKAKASSAVRAFSGQIHGSGYQTLAVPLDFEPPSEIAKALAAVTSKDIVVFSDDKLGLLVLGGNQTELESAIDTIHLFDRANFQDAKIRFFDLQQAATQTLSADLNKMIEASKVSGVTVVPLKRLNGLFVVAQSSTALTQIGDWIRRLDVPSRERTLSLWVYHPRNLSADALGTALNGVIGGQSASSQTTTSPTASPGPSNGAAAATSAATAIPGGGASPFGAPTNNINALSTATTVSSEDDPVRIGVDKQTNTLLFSASQAHWIQIQKTLDQLDQAPGQVLIEASILEVTLSNQFNTGVDWSSLTDGGRLTASNINSASGAVAQTIPGLSVTFLEKDIKAAISALSAQTTVEVISAPKIVALDNHEAKLTVGADVPITTEAQQSTSGTTSPILNSYSYRSTGVILTVTPRIGGDGRVMLSISQEVSSVANTTSSSINSPTIQERKVNTTLMLANGGLVALGGMISTNKNVTDSGIPYLSSIPVAGSLFKTHTNSQGRTELIVLISAKIIQDTVGADKATAALLADMKDINAHGLLAH